MLLSLNGRSTFTAAPAEFGTPVHDKSVVIDANKEESHAMLRAANLLGRHPAAFKVGPTARRWSWLANTYWYVPASNVTAVLSNSITGTVTSITDQTVFHITSYSGGYFWGSVVAQYGSDSPNSAFMVGSVTPKGKVLLSFTTTGTGSAPSNTYGYGTMERKYGQWTMANQMLRSLTATVQIGHWAYMAQTHPGLPSWYSLPAVGVSVPEFLSE